MRKNILQHIGTIVSGRRNKEPLTQRQLLCKFAVCTEDERAFLLKTLDCMTEQPRIKQPNKVEAPPARLFVHQFCAKDKWVFFAICLFRI